MIRLFEQHQVREQKELEGYWEFTTLSEWVLPCEYRSKMYVPGCIENDITYKTYRGKMAYKKTFTLREAGFYKITFKGVSHTAKVYIDGLFIKEHYNAYTAFDVIFEATQEKQYTLEVLVDNSFSDESTLHIPNDYYTYGGLIKPVVLEKVSTRYIDHLQWNSKKVNNLWQISIQIKIKECRNFYGDLTYKTVEEGVNTALIGKKNEVIKLYLDDNLIGMPIISSAMGEQRHQVDTYLLDFETENTQDIEWSHKNPKLFLLRVEMVDSETDEIIDDLIERVGFREIKVVENELNLNDQSIFLQGVNRHEDFNIFGCSQPTQAMAIDLSLMNDLYCNTVRTSHYPNDERFLDMCDELGVYVWEENHARGLSLEDMQKPKFDEQCRQCNEEMILQHFNHPSIIIWGILNECASHTLEGKEKYAKQFEQIRSLDRSRPLTFASCQHFKDLTFEFVDIVSTNLYYGWYDECKNEEEIRKGFEKQLEWIKETKGSNKPLIISEFGAGALYGFRAPHAPKWSEERQAMILRDTLNVYLNHPNVCGTYIWQFCDVRVTEEEWAMRRPRSMNNKGVVDEYRRPKLSYTVVQELYKKKVLLSDK